MWLASVIAAFAGGVYFRIAYYVFPSAIHSFTVQVDGLSSLDGNLYSSQGIAEANKVADFLISSSTSRNKNFDPKVIITPAHGGYTIHYTSGSPVSDFPDDLLSSVQRAVAEVLYNDLQNEAIDQKSR